MSGAVNDVLMDDELSHAYGTMMAALDDLLLAIGSDGDVAAAARATEDAMESLHDLLEQRYGLGLISEWTDPDDVTYDGPVVRVRLALDVQNETVRDDVMSLVDERLCEGLDAKRFAILSTTRVFPGARGTTADTRRAGPPAVLARSKPDALADPPEVSAKLEKRRERLVQALQSLLEALAIYGDHPRNKNLQRVYKRQERFEARVERLQRQVMRRTGSPLVTTWAYLSDDLPWSGPVVLRTVFDVAEGETTEELLAAITQTLDGLAPVDFTLASAGVLDH